MNYKIDFVKNRNKFFGLSLAITVLGIITLLIFNLNYGVDFKAGTTLDVSLGGETITKERAEQLIAGAVKATPVISVGGESERFTARFDTVLTEEETLTIIAAFKQEYGEAISYQENTVDPSMAVELAYKALFAVAAASIGIILYVSIRFEWRFAIAAIVALLHDAFIVVSLFSIFRLEVNLPFVAAILTIIGYSINDTIVIFDRIRENLRFAKIKSFQDLSDLVNTSIWQTMARSINTALTVLIAALCLYIFGSISIKLFSLAMIFGLISGGYSSIFIASQLWLLLKHKSIRSAKPAVARD